MGSSRLNNGRGAARRITSLPPAAAASERASGRPRPWPPARSANPTSSSSGSAASPGPSSDTSIATPPSASCASIVTVPSPCQSALPIRTSRICRTAAGGARLEGRSGPAAVTSRRPRAASGACHRVGDEETLALRGVSLAVPAGKLLTVAGPSGSGKSTLLACLAGLDEPDGGSVYVQETRISHRPEQERSALRARHIGTLFQTANLLEHLTVRRNLELVQRIARASDRPGDRPSDKHRVDAL